MKRLLVTNKHFNGEVWSQSSFLAAPWSVNISDVGRSFSENVFLLASVMNLFMMGLFSGGGGLQNV